mgnify:CR=1 FL=1
MHTNRKAAAEAIDGYEQIWKAVNIESRAYLPYNAYDDEGNQLPKPERQTPAVMPAAQVQLLQLPSLNGSQLGRRVHRRLDPLPVRPVFVHRPLPIPIACTSTQPSASRHGTGCSRAPSPASPPSPTRCASCARCRWAPRNGWSSWSTAANAGCWA